MRADELRVGDVWPCDYDGPITVTSVTPLDPDETFPRGAVRFTGRFRRMVEGKQEHTWLFHADQWLNIERTPDVCGYCTSVGHVASHCPTLPADFRDSAHAERLDAELRRIVIPR